MLKPGHKAVVDQCRQLLLQTLEEGFGLLIDQIGDDLFQASSATKSNVQQMTYLDAVTVARNQEENVWPEYSKIVEAAWEKFWREGRLPTDHNAVGGGGSEELSLSLVEKDELEEELTAVTLISKTNDVCSRPLFGLNVRFAHLLGRKELENDENPAAPQLLTLGFREVIDRWPMEVPARVVVLKSFGKVVLSRLKQCYEAMNLQLAEKNVVPKLDYSAFVRAGHGGGGRRGAERRAAGVEPVSQISDESIEVPPLEEIWQNLQGLGQIFGVPAQGGEQIQITRGELLKALSQIQPTVADSEAAEDGRPLDQSLLRDWLTQILQARAEEEEKGVRVGAAEQQVIDVIMALFEHLMEDPNLPDAMRALIGRLQIPTLKAAMVDDSFIHNEEHPARRLIDELAQASVGWRDDGDRSENSLYMQVKKAVDRIVHEYDEDIGLFEEVRQEFVAWRERQERRRKALEERLAQEISGRERLEVARAKVDQLLRTLIPRNLPEPALKILTGPWRKLLTILMLQEGEEGRNWQRAVNIARLIVEYLGEKGRPGESREERMARFSRLMGGVKRGFVFISLDRKQANQLLDGLRGCFIELLQQPETEQETQPLEPPSSVMASESGFGEPPDHPSTFADTEIAPSVLLNPREETADRERDEFDEQAANLPEGSWIKIEPAEGEEGEPLVCKLVWRSQYTGTMVFVDGQGNKAAQLKEHEMAEHFRRGRASLLEDAQAPLIERALKRMIRALRGGEEQKRAEAG